MSEQPARGGAPGIDKLLAESGLEDAADIRAGLIELRALGAVRPEPSEALRALMVPAASGSFGAAPAPVDELAARRRKRRLAVTAVAVAASLAAGATAAAASDGGIPGTLDQLGSAVGAAVSKLFPAPQPAPPAEPDVPAPSPSPAPGTAAPSSPSSGMVTPGAGSPAPAPEPSRVPVAPRPVLPRVPLDRTVELPVPVPLPSLPVPSPSLPELPAK